MTSRAISMENQVRIFRKNPIAWWDKNAMRYLRRKYGQDKKTFALLRSVYLALCEMESDFTDTSINFFTQTVGTYAGTSRQVAGKYINMLEKDGLIAKVRMRDAKTQKYLPGTFIEILDFHGFRHAFGDSLKWYFPGLVFQPCTVGVFPRTSALMPHRTSADTRGYAATAWTCGCSHRPAACVRLSRGASTKRRLRRSRRARPNIWRFSLFSRHSACPW